ncbi:MAG TPA: DNA repair protein RecO [Burkholderiaceae bacterium]|jgi:DNA repair protein RecO (recombination protein O)|nr:DNA repair protein RecO [Burkholderiaceae bacterium]
MLPASMKVEHQAAFLLHSVPYRETSLVVDLFTRDYGRIAAVAKGARRPHSALRGVLLQFQPLAAGWTGRRELRTLTAAHWVGGMASPQGDALLCAFYLNELLMKLLPREDPHPGLYEGYVQALLDLCSGAPLDDTLRRFEWVLLRETGYAPDLAHDTADEPIDEERFYRWRPSAGFMAADPAAGGGTAGLVSGETLRSLAAGSFESTRARTQAKYLTRAILAHHLDGATLNTRQILIDLHKL